MFAYYCLIPVIDDDTVIRITDYVTRKPIYRGLCRNFRNADYYLYIVEWIYAAGSELVIEIRDTNCN